MIGVGTSLLFDRRAGKAGSITGVMGNEMALKNFTYSFSSGFGKYEIDFNS